MDFYFGEKSHSARFVDFLEGVVPTKVRIDSWHDNRYSYTSNLPTLVARVDVRFIGYRVSAVLRLSYLYDYAQLGQPSIIEFIYYSNTPAVTFQISKYTWYFLLSFFLLHFVLRVELLYVEWLISPFQSSEFSFEYVLLRPRFAPGHVHSTSRSTMRFEPRALPVDDRNSRAGEESSHFTRACIDVPGARPHTPPLPTLPICYCPMVQVKHSKKLISADNHSNIFNFHYTYLVTLVPVCKDDVVLLPKRLAEQLGNISRLTLAQRITSAVQFVDPRTAQTADVTEEKVGSISTPCPCSGEILCFVMDACIVRVMANDCWS